MKPTWQTEDGAIALYLGDCLDVLPTLKAGSVDAVCSDPPYGVNIGNHHGAAECRSGWLTKGTYEDYDDSPENYRQVVVPAIEQSLALASRGMVFAVPPTMWMLPPANAIGGMYVPAAMGRNKWGFSSFISCLLYGTRPGLENGCTATAILSNASATPNGHPCPKPLPWMLWCVKLGTLNGEVVLDPFMGSGTTGVACVRTGRSFIGIEREPKYFDIAVKRIEAELNRNPLFEEAPKIRQRELLETR